MSLMTGKDTLIELLYRKGVKYVFGLPGATEIHFMTALEKRPEITFVLGLHEAAVAGMAEGYARMTGEVGVINLHTLPGLAAALPILDNAYKGRIPLVVTAGQQDMRLLLKDPPLSGDLLRMASQVTKWSVEVTSADDIPLTIHRAFKIALQPPAGPVFISLPHNILEQSFDFEDIPDMQIYDQLRPDQDAIIKAAELLMSAQLPTILVEKGVTMNRALPEVVKLAELVGARVYQPWMSDVDFPVNHPQYLGDLDASRPQTKEILHPVDVLVAIGCPLFEQAFYLPGNVLRKETRIIQIDDNPWEIAKNIPVTVGIQANIKAALVELTNLLEKKMSDKEKGAAQSRKSTIVKEKESIVSAFQKKAEQERDNVPISVSRLMNEVKDVITPDTLVIDDCWSSSGVLRHTLELSQPFSYQRTRGGSIGWGLPGAIGVKLAAPEQPVLALCGDGSAIWSIQSLWTASHLNLNITFVIISNRSYRQVKIMRKIVLGEGSLADKHPGMDLDEPAIDFCQLARAMGVEATRVEKPEQLKETLKSSLAANKPTLVEVVVENQPGF